MSRGIEAKKEVWLHKSDCMTASVDDEDDIKIAKKHVEFKRLVNW